MSCFQSVRDSDGGLPNPDTNFFYDILKLFANNIIEFPYISGIMLRNGAWKNIHYWCNNEDGLAFVRGFIGATSSDEAKCDILVFKPRFRLSHFFGSRRAFLSFRLCNGN